MDDKNNDPGCFTMLLFLAMALFLIAVIADMAERVRNIECAVKGESTFLGFEEVCPKPTKRAG